MQQIKLRKEDSLDNALKRLKEMVMLEGTLDEVRRLRAFETEKEKRIRKSRRNARIGKYLRTKARQGFDNYEKLDDLGTLEQGH
jgi:small subunit ribosomal protein S21